MRNNEMKRFLTFWILALLASVSEAFAALAGTASSFQSSRQFACDDAKHKTSIDADFKELHRCLMNKRLVKNYLKPVARLSRKVKGL